MKTWIVGFFLFYQGLYAGIPWFVDFMNLESPVWALSNSSKVSEVIISNGHFYNASGRVRFWGINITGPHNYPPKNEAPRIARSLRLLGFTIVRLHFMEHSWGNSLLRSPMSEELDPAALDRLDYFVFCLKKEGLYVNINLHVGRIFPQIPEKDKEVVELGKIVSYLDDTLVASQKRYASLLLGHTNPYTGMPYSLDPVVAVIEVNNENALTGVDLHYFSRLSSYYQNILRRLWNSYLHRIYTNYAQWKEANIREESKKLFISQTNTRQRYYWRWETIGLASSSFHWDRDTLVWKVEKSGNQSWHNQFMCAGFPLLAGERYEITFEARSLSHMPFIISLMQDHEPWYGLGFWTNIMLSSSWKRYQFFFVGEVDDHRVRLNFSTELSSTGVIEMRNFVLFQPNGKEISETTWQKGEISLPWEGLSGKKVIADFRNMLLEREREVVVALRNHIRALGCKKPITHTQVTYGGVAGLAREGALSDFVDVHTYWQHPQFPRQMWSATDWWIENKSQLMEEGLGPLSYIAYWRVLGKPFTVSEYSVPDPNFYAYEAPIWLALWGIFQEWDGVYLYTLLDFGGNYDQKYQKGFFHFLGSGGKMSLLPWAAHIFHEGMSWPYEEVRSMYLNQLEKEYTRYGPWYDVKRLVGWTNESLYARVKIGLDGKENVVTSSLRMPWVWDRQRPFLLWKSDKALLLTGNIQDMEVTNAFFRIKVSKGSQWGVVACCTLDGKGWDKTKQIFMTIVGRGENTGMVWNSTKTSIGDKWGRPPYHLFQPDVRVYMPGFRAFFLDERGLKSKEVISHKGWFYLAKTTPWIVFETIP